MGFKTRRTHVDIEAKCAPCQFAEFTWANATSLAEGKRRREEDDNAHISPTEMAE